MASSVKFYFDLVSPVSRPFVILFNYAKISCEMVEVKLRKGNRINFNGRPFRLSSEMN